MRSLIFKEVDIEGFQCIINRFKYRLNTPGVNIIVGENGEGKTTIFSAMVWGLYGITLKSKNSPTPWEDFQTSKYRGTKVEVAFNRGKAEYRIIRCHKFKGDVEGSKGGNRVILMKNGAIIPLDKGKANVQQQINQLVGYSPRLFLNSVVFGQKLVRLISASGPDKKKVLEEAFEVTFIEAAISNAKEQIQSIQDSIQPLLIKKASLEAAQSILGSQLKNLRENHKQHKAKSEALMVKKRETLVKLKEKHDKLSKQLTAYNSSMIKINTHLVKIERLNKSLRAANFELSALKAELQKLDLHLSNNAKLIAQHTRDMKDIPKVCDKCGSPLKKAQIRERTLYYQKQIEKIRSAPNNSTMADRSELAGNINRIISEITIIEQRLDRVNKKTGDISEKRVKVAYIQSELEHLSREIKDIETREVEKSPYLPEIKDTKRSLKEATSKLASLAQTMSKLEEKLLAFKWVLNDPLSNSGIKALIFANMLRLLNSKLKTYSKYLGFQVVFQVDLDGKRKDLNVKLYQGDNIRDYVDLSGGQQQLVDVCIAFGMHDALREKSPINLLILDEIFESLSVKNIEKVTEIISDKSAHNSVYLITHRKDFIMGNANIKRIRTKYKGKIQLV